MTRRALLPFLVLAAVLTACTSTGGPTDREPRSTRHVAPAGFRTVSFHGIGVDVPNTARLALRPTCAPGLPPTGALVVPLFDGGASSCPTPSAGGPGPTPRPASLLTVVLAETGNDPDLAMPSPRHVDVVDAGVTVTASGPSETVDAVLASVRLTSQDALGCIDRIDPTVAPRNIDSADGSLLPVATSRVVVCEYGDTAVTPTDAPRHWLVGSRELTDDEATAVATRIGAAPTAAAAGTDPTPFGPVLRLLVLGRDGNTRTLQATIDSDPQAVNDDRRTVAVDPVSGGEYTPLPTPFDNT